MTEEKKNNSPENTGEPPKPTGEPPKEEKKQRKPKTEKQIEAAKRNLLKIRNKGRQSTHSEESKVIIRDEHAPACGSQRCILRDTDSKSTA